MTKPARTTNAIDTRKTPIRAKTTVPAPPERPTVLPPSGIRVRVGTRTSAGGPGARVPARARIARDALATEIDHRMAFILLHVDGLSTVDEIAFVSSMPLDEVVRTLDELVARGLVVFT